MSPSIQYIPSLTPLRGIAALFVVLFHYNDFLMFLEYSNINEWTLFIKKGYLWVDFFFILSGFIICHVYGVKLQEGSKHTLKKYLWARFSRLYPLHFFVLMLFLVMVFGLWYFFPDYYATEQPKFYRTYDFFIQLFWLNTTGLTNSFGWNLPSWSIAAEWWTYIIAIWLIPYLNRGFSTRIVVSWIIAIMCLMGITLTIPDYRLDAIFALGTVRCLCSFTIGIGIYQAYLNLLDKETLWKRDSSFLLLILATIIILHFGWYDIIVIPFFASLILAASLNRTKVQAILNNRFLTVLGDVSFSLYMIHILVLINWWNWVTLYFKPAYPGLDPSSGVKFAWLGVIIVICWGLSYLTYTYIELPAQRKLRDLYKKGQQKEVTLQQG